MTATAGVDRRPHESFFLPVTTHLVVFVCTALALATTVRCWLTDHAAAAKEEAAKATQQRVLFAEEVADAYDALKHREDAFRRTVQKDSRERDALATRAADAECALAREQLAHADLRKEFDDLADDHNALIMSQLQAGANTFAARYDSETSGESLGNCIPFPAQPPPVKQPAKTPMRSSRSAEIAANPCSAPDRED